MAKWLIFLARPEGFPYYYRASEPPTYRFVVEVKPFVTRWLTLYVLENQIVSF